MLLPSQLGARAPHDRRSPFSSFSPFAVTNVIGLFVITRSITSPLLGPATTFVLGTHYSCLSRSSSCRDILPPPSRVSQSEGEKNSQLVSKYFFLGERPRSLLSFLSPLRGVNVFLVQGLRTLWYGTFSPVFSVLITNMVILTDRLYLSVFREWNRFFESKVPSIRCFSATSYLFPPHSPITLFAALFCIPTNAKGLFSSRLPACEILS